MAEAFIALGGNVGDVRAVFDRAVATLCDGTLVKLRARSADYRTPPWGVIEQPPFINAVIAVETTLDPHDLLKRAKECEQALGRHRERERRWGPRAIDIDLLDYDGIRIEEPDLQLPHPRILERAFVLVPLAEIVPDRMVSGVRVADALAFLQGLRTTNVLLLCDLFHMNIEEADLAAALRLAGPKVGHVHFADSNRRAVGLGHTDMRPIMSALREIGYAGYLSAEVLPLPDSQSAAAQTITAFRQLLTDH